MSGVFSIVRLMPVLAPPVEWYRTLAEADVAVLDADIRYDKRAKAMHRFNIITRTGPASITVPVSRPDGIEGRPLRWSDIRVSPHNHWWQQAVSTLATVYGPSPYYDYLMPEFAQFFSEAAVGRSVIDYNLAFDATVRRLLGLSTRITCALPTPPPAPIATPIILTPSIEFTTPSILHHLFTEGTTL